MRFSKRFSKRSSPFTAIGCAGMTFFIAMAAHAEDDATDYFSMDLEQLMRVKIEVATRRPQTVSEAPAIITVFQRSELEHLGVTSLIDVLKHAPGIETSLSPDGHWRIAVRGLRKDGNILLLIDNQAFNDGYDGHANFDLPIAFIERVEVIRGPGSALYGSNAVVGVVNVVTRTQGRAAEVRVGSADDAGVAALYGRTTASPAWTFYGGVEHHDGANVQVATGSAPGDPETERGGRTARWRDDAWLGASFHRDAWDWRLLLLDRARGGWAGGSLQAVTDDSDLQESNLRSQLKMTLALAPQWQLTPSLHYGQVDHDFLINEVPAGFEISGVIFPDGAYTREQYQIINVGTDTQLHWQTSDTVSVLSGVVYDHQKMQDYDLQRNYQAAGPVPQTSFGNYDNLIFHQDHKSRDVFAAYLQMETQWRDFSLTLGGRYDRYNDFGSARSPRLGVVYQARANLSFKLLHAEAFRAPTLKELYDYTRVGSDGHTGNDDLQAETIQTTELGAEWALTDVLLRGNLFTQKVDDLIAIYDPVGSGSIGHYDNIGTLSGYGGEFEIIWDTADGVQLYLNVSRFENDFTWGPGVQFRDDRLYQGTQGEKRVYHSPRIRANAGAKTRFGSWSAFVGVNYGGRTVANNHSRLQGFRAFREGQVDIRDSRQWDVNIGWQQNANLDWSLSANYLGDDKYSDPDDGLLIDRYGLEGLQQPGASYVLRLQYHW